MTSPGIKTPLMQAAAIIGLSLVLGIVFNFFFFDQLPGLSFPVYIAIVVAGVFGLASIFNHKIHQATWWLALPLIGFATMVAIRSSIPLRLMNIMACLLLLLLIARVAFRRRLTDMRVLEFLTIPLLPLQFFKPALQSVARILATHKIIKTNPLTAQIIKGVAITVPVLVVFVALFASADLVVQKYVADHISLHIDGETAARLILILVVATALTAGYSYIFNAPEPEKTTTVTPSRSFIGKVESSILFVSVNVLFLSFIFVQIAYLFGGQTTIAAQGFTYAEYARKGFFELLVVAVVAFGLLWTAEKYVRRTQRGHSTLFKILSIALVLQVIAIMGSAFKRLALYEQAYGFTTLRLYSHAFTILLAILFVILAYKIIRSASDQAFAFPALLTIIAFLAAMNALNPDAFIARQNLSRYQETGKIDTYYLGQLSDDAVPTLIDGSPILQPKDAQAFDATLHTRQTKAKSNKYQDWQSWNLSKDRADSALAKLK